eukprot:Lankesteria_metandrocarpae@DN8744_c0_g1_i1.p1
METAGLLVLLLVVAVNGVVGKKKWDPLSATVDLYTWMEKNTPSEIVDLPTTENTNKEWTITTGKKLQCETCQGLVYTVWKTKSDTEARLKKQKTFGASQLAIDSATDVESILGSDHWDYHASRTEVFWSADMLSFVGAILEGESDTLSDFLEEGKTEDEAFKSMCVERLRVCSLESRWTSAEKLEARLTQSDFHGSMGVKFLELNKANASVQETESGLQIKTIKKGDLDTLRPTMTSLVELQYNATFVNGITFESSVDNENGIASGAVYSFDQPLSDLLMKMGEGADLIFYVPPKLAFHSQGKESLVPQSATVLYRIQLLKVTLKDDDDDDAYDEDEDLEDFGDFQKYFDAGGIEEGAEVPFKLGEVDPSAPIFDAEELPPNDEL